MSKVGSRTKLNSLVKKGNRDQNYNLRIDKKKTEYILVKNQVPRRGLALLNPYHTCLFTINVIINESLKQRISFNT